MGTEVDTEVFDDFYRHHYRLFLTVAQQRLDDPGDAEDVTAELFRIAWLRYCTGEPLTLAWSYGVLRNLIGDEYRRRTRKQRLLFALRPLASDRAEAEQAKTEQSDTALDIHQALREVSESDREIVRMTYWEGLSSQEISEIMGCSPVAVRARLSRARKRLKKVLDKDAEQLAFDINPDRKE